MFKIVFILLTLFTSSHASAEWTLLTSDENSDVYYDQKTIKKHQQIAEMYTLANATNPKVIDLATSLSQVTHTQFDCNKKVYNVLSLTVYAGHMGKGQKVMGQQYSKKGWKKIAPKSTWSSALKKACSTK
ncbi:MAG TPA: surface-adhesin E family protein [Methylophilus sp.]